MWRRRLVFATLWAALALAPPVAGGDSSRSKLPSPARALQAAAKSFVKAKSYRVELGVVGGFSDVADHAVKQRVVQEKYLGKVYSGMMFLPEVKAYRTTKRGTAYLDGSWKDILSDRRTVKIVRLFRFPEEVLGNAIRHAPRSGQWIEPVAGNKDGEAKAAEGESAVGGGATAEAGSEGTDSRTAVASSRDSKDPSAAATEEIPRVIRVEAPPEEALQHIIEVQNSNCFGVG